MSVFNGAAVVLTLLQYKGVPREELDLVDYAPAKPRVLELMKTRKAVPFQILEKYISLTLNQPWFFFFSFFNIIALFRDTLQETNSDKLLCLLIFFTQGTHF